MFFAHEAITFPLDLDQALDKVLNSRIDLSKRSRRGESLRGLWPKLAKGRGQNAEGEQHYSFRRDEADAYAAYYLPANCLKPALVMEESLLSGCNPVPENSARWLDLGTGPGTAFWGLAWWFARRGKKLHFTGWDQSSNFASIASDLASGNPFGARAEFIAGGEGPFSLIRKLKPTHVSFVNSVAEIYPDPKQREEEIAKIIRALQDLERKDGQERFLLLLEPGSRESSRELATLKDRLQTEGIGQMILPCLDRRACGALSEQRDWCHEEVACDFPDWLNRLGAEASLRKEAMLFSYMWMKARAGTPFPLEGGLRIVSQRMERKGQVECRLCTKSGKIPVRVQRSKVTSENEFLLSSGRGDLWPSASIGDKNDLERAARFSPLSQSIFSSASQSETPSRN